MQQERHYRKGKSKQHSLDFQKNTLDVGERLLKFSRQNKRFSTSAGTTDTYRQDDRKQDVNRPRESKRSTERKILVHTMTLSGVFSQAGTTLFAGCWVSSGSVATPKSRHGTATLGRSRTHQ